MGDEKPFKTIEVVDSRTNQVCKVACMSCIRGHRTTSCGIPVCRTKIFWTVKRPGRPSNSCTCRYGVTGGCKCVVARSACPHKSKKGEKRSGECRCDEQGRYCCLLEPEHWNALLALQKPTIDLFPSREALEHSQTAPTPAANSHVAVYSSATSPTTTHSMPGTPGQLNGRPQPVHILPNTFNGFQPTQTMLTPRFGMMGIGAPMGSPAHVPVDLLAWEGQAPTAPRDFPSHQTYEAPGAEGSSCCQPAIPSVQNVQSPPPPPVFSPSQPLQDMQLPQPYDDLPAPQTVSMSQVSQTAATYDFNKFQTDYFNYQFPGSICQNCGLNGCTCRNCPPVFQNFGTTSWAQCCGRKHARDVQPTPPPRKKQARTETYGPAQGRISQMTNEEPTTARGPPAPTAFETDGMDFPEEYKDMGLHPPDPPPPEFEHFDLDQALIMPDGTELGDLSEFLLSELDTSNPVGNEEIDRGENKQTPREFKAAGEDEDQGDGGGGGGGCCCGG